MKKDELRLFLERDGFYVLKDVFDFSKIKYFKDIIFKYLDFFPNTRPSPGSRHLAGFHRYPELVTMHSDILSNKRINNALRLLSSGGKWISIGLTDITINRSQQWHSDLLRGRYKHHIYTNNSQAINDGGVYKVLLYLQKGKQLKVIPGSHKTLSSLDDDSSEKLASKSDVKTLEIDQGDVILMDIRLQHKGADENEMMQKELNEDAKILVSTVVGDSTKKLTNKMIIGNAHRQKDWDEKHLPTFFY